VGVLDLFFIPLQEMVVLATIVYSSMSSRFSFPAPLLAEGPGLSSQGSV